MKIKKNNWLTFSIITAVLIVLLDVGEHSHYAGFTINDLDSLLAVLSVMGLVFIVYWLLYVFIVMPVLRFSKLDSTNYDIGLTIFMLVLQTFYVLHRHVKFGHFSLDLRLPALVIAAFIVALSLSAVVVYLLKNIRQNTFKKYLTRIGLLMSIVSVIVMSTFAFVNTSKSSYTKIAKTMEKPTSGPEYVVFILIDTLRADTLSCINPDSRPTPNIDALAKDGILFNNARSTSPWTTPSVASILTGLSPLVHRVMTVESQLPDNLTTIAEYFSQHNYHTAGFSQNPMLVGKNFEKGFSIFKHQSQSSKRIPLHNILMKLFSKKLKKAGMTKHSNNWATKHGIKWLDNNIDNHSFLYVHYMDPHHPYSPGNDFLPNEEPPEKIGKSFSDFMKIRKGQLILNKTEKAWVQKLYEAETVCIDKNVGAILDYLKRKGIYDETLIVLTSDHGEEFWEHGNIEHGHSLYTEQLHIPLIIKKPFQTVGKVIDTRVKINSITPTVLDICNIQYNSKSMTAISLAPVILKEKPAIPTNVVATGLLYYDNLISAEFDDFKYIEHLANNRQELYNLKDDPEELYNIAKYHDDIIERAKEIIAENHKITMEMRNYYNLKDAETTEMDKGTLEMLRSLGYVE